jgi:RimJ/RimL family protein N-acetyltransferase
VTEPFPEVIRTERLELVLMSVPFMEALQRGDLEAASREISATTSPWLAEQLVDFLKYRLGQVRADPSVRGWLGRAIVVTGDDGSREAIGSIGFHGPPDDGKLEIGYSVDPRYRRRGYAREAVKAMLDWAYETHGISRFVASVGPWNEPSLNLIGQFGFRKVGEQMDDIDGLEYVFETTWPLAERAEFQSQ